MYYTRPGLKGHLNAKQPPPSKKKKKEETKNRKKSHRTHKRYKEEVSMTSRFKTESSTLLEAKHQIKV